MAVTAAQAAVAGAPFMGPGTLGALSPKSTVTAGSGAWPMTTSTRSGTQPGSTPLESKFSS